MLLINFTHIVNLENSQLQSILMKLKLDFADNTLQNANCRYLKWISIVIIIFLNLDP